MDDEGWYGINGLRIDLAPVKCQFIDGMTVLLDAFAAAEPLDAALPGALIAKAPHAQFRRAAVGCVGGYV